MRKAINPKKGYIDDDKIVDLFWQRKEQAIEETDRKYGKLVFKIAYNILNDTCDCEECRNDTYLGAWNSIPPTRPHVFFAYLTQITRHLAINK